MINPRNNDSGDETGMAGPWPVLVIFALPFACMIALRFIGLDWLQQALPSLPVKAANFPVLGAWAFTLAILFRAKPAGWADLRRICLFILIVEVAAILLVLAGAGLLRQSSLDPQGGEFLTIEFVTTVGVIFLLCEFLMRLGLLPGCSSWRVLRRVNREEQRPVREHYRPRHWVTGLLAGLAVAGLAWPLLAWLTDAAVFDALKPEATMSMAMMMGLMAGLAMALSRPPDGGTWGRSVLAGLLAALLIPAGMVALDESAFVWAPTPDYETAIVGVGKVLSVLGAFIPPLIMVGVAAVTLGGLPADPDAKPAGEDAPAAKPRRWKPFTFDHAAAAAILFLCVWAGAFALMSYLAAAYEDGVLSLIDPAMAALLMGLAATATPVLARPTDVAGWAVTAVAVLLILLTMLAAMVALTFAIPFCAPRDPDVFTVLRVIHYAALLPAAAILATAAWMQGRQRVEGEEGA